MYLKILDAVPDYFPAQYNYATTLIYRKRIHEAVPIVKALVDEHPNYLFAAATLIEVFCVQDREKEATALLEAMVLPTETHPSAMIAWLLARRSYYEMIGEYESAGHCFEEAFGIDPDNFAVKQLLARFQ